MHLYAVNTTVGTAVTNIDALTHAVKSYVSSGAHKLTDYISLESI